MRKKVVVRAPVLTRSGYGEHGRFVIRSLRSREDDLFDIYVVPITWGQTGWICRDDEERSWMDEAIKKTVEYTSRGGQFDMSIQVTIPNEWEPMAPINIGVTAGIESTKVAPVWLEKAAIMDKIVVVSEHSKWGFENTVYHGQNRNTGQPMTLKCEVPIDVVHYPVKSFNNLSELDLGLDYEMNYLAVAQHGPRKNLENTIKWFVEENFDEEVGLVVKTFFRNNSLIDRYHAEDVLSNIMSQFPDRKCKVYLLHGDMSDKEMHSLYSHPQIKCLVSLTHGEGFGLPLFEAAYCGLPIIAPGWSGHCDFLYAPHLGEEKKNKNKKSKQPYFLEIEYDIQPVNKSAVWDGVLVEDSMWCYPKEGSFKMNLRRLRKNYDKWKKKADLLQGWVIENFEPNSQYDKFVSSISSTKESEDSSMVIF